MAAAPADPVVSSTTAPRFEMEYDCDPVAAVSAKASIPRAFAEGVALQVRDDGTGFDYKLAKKFPRGLGLLIMDYCATNAGLRFNVSSNEGGGVTVRAIMANPREKAEN